MLLIENRTGIAIHAGLQDALIDILRQQNDVDAYLRNLINTPEDHPDWQALFNALLIGETYFFRHSQHVQALQQHLLPDLIKRKRTQGNLQLTVWSAGCATGEEAYSLAILLHQALPEITEWSLNIVGSDLNNQALKHAKRGTYRQWSFRHTEEAFQKTYFSPVPNGWSIKPYWRQMVRFQQANLLTNPPVQEADLILCRNVLLYFGSAHIRQAESTLFSALAPGGWLLLGQAERLRHHRERWTTHQFEDTIVYQRRVPTDQLQQQTSPPATTDTTTYEDIVITVQQAHYDRAERLLRQFLTIYPSHASAHLLLAYLHANRRTFDSAHTHIDTALYLNPLLADAYYLRGALFMEVDRVTDARKAFDSALYCQRNHPLASYILGNLHAANGDLPRALRSWQNAYKAVSSLKADSPVSDISDITAGQLTAMLNAQLDGWQG